MVSGRTAVRDNEISKETNIREIGAMCLTCGHKRAKASEEGFTRQCPPMDWRPVRAAAL